MKMEQQRELLKNPPYKHSCNCMTKDFQYLQELPKTGDCVNSKYYKRSENDKWIDVTNQVKINKY